MSGDPLERVSRAALAAAGDDPRVATFARGLVVGALVGAAIAGSTLWQRRRRPAREAIAPPATAIAAPDPAAAAHASDG
jgi:hypothetical protein